jgi:uncharacterized repeat protein (TIGR01451 family)
VRYAFPAEWLRAGGLSEAEIAQLLDLTDLVYKHMAEVVRGEPANAQDGAGTLLTIAVVPTVSPAGQPVSGLGAIARKGVEINPNTLLGLKSNLAQGLVTEVAIHEMSHNFDLYHAWLTYGHDWAHAWTNFLIPYIQHYSRSGSLLWDSDALLDKTQPDYLGQWRAAGAAATWDACVRDQQPQSQCLTIRPNDVWAGFLLTYARFHGPNALKRAMDYLKAYKAAHPVPTGTADENNDTLVEALASGAGVNVTGDVDWLRWKVSPTERAGLASRFPTLSPYSLDRDGDTFKPLDGDTDDANASVHPGAAEVQNGKDDDCNGLVDEQVVRESDDLPSFAWEETATLSAPSRLAGTHNSAQDLDAVRLDVPAACLARFTLKTTSQSNVTLDIRHGSIQGQITQLSGTDVMSKTVFLDRPGTWWLQVSAQPGGFGTYELLVGPAPDDLDSLTATARGQAGAPLTLSAAYPSGIVIPTSATSIRYWAAGVGLISQSAPQGTILWTPPSGLEVSVRAQLMQGVTPLSRFSAAAGITDPTPTPTPTPSPTPTPTPTPSPTPTPTPTPTLIPDVAVRPAVTFSTPVSNVEAVEFKFEITNEGQAEAVGVTINCTLPQGMTLTSATASRGQVVTGGNTVTLTLGTTLLPSEVVTLTVRAIGLGLVGTFVASATVSSSGADGDLTNNSASLPVTLRQPPEVPPAVEQKIYRLPLRPAGSQGPEIVAQTALARVVVPATGLNLQQPVYAMRSPDGGWPTTLAGLDISVGGLPAIILAVASASPAAAGGETYTVDFVVPDAAQTGTEVPVTVRHTSSSRAWNYVAQILDSAPALWGANSMAEGQAVAQSADNYTVIDALFPATADGTSRVALYATGIRKLVGRGGLTIRARTTVGVEAQLPVEYAGPHGNLPGLDLIILRLPVALAGSGIVLIVIDGAPESAVLLPVR